MKSIEKPHLEDPVPATRKRGQGTKNGTLTFSFSPLLCLLML